MVEPAKIFTTRRWTPPIDEPPPGRFDDDEINVDTLHVDKPKPVIVRPVELQGIEIPTRQWLVRHWAPKGVVTGLYGEGGLGKTLLAQQLQTATALGRSWIGLDTTPARSLAMYCEDSADELHRRQADIDAAYGCDFSDLDGALWSTPAARAAL